MVAHVTVTGRIGTAPERRKTHSQVDYTRFRMAHTPRLRRGDEWVDGETIWFTVRCYGALARNVSLLRKGDGALVTGQWRVESWIDDNGVAHMNNVVLADAVGPDMTVCGAHVVPPIRPGAVPDRDAVDPEESRALEESEDRIQVDHDAADRVDADGCVATASEPDQVPVLTSRS